MASAETNRQEAAPGTSLEVTVEKLVHGGAGLARHQGRVILVSYVLPGERVRVAIRGARAGVLEAQLEELLEASDQRVNPPCPYFGRCGGCQLQHGRYELQLEIKRAVLLETLRRLGGIELSLEPQIVAGPGWQYRNRVQLHLRAGRIGFFQAASERLCSIEQCMIASPRINQALAALRQLLSEAGIPRSVKTLEVFSDEQRVQINVRAGAETRTARRRVA
ncbi:MAG: class I SAM-dependent RNA methyltransferase, partial [Bryobacteraceae bacterium]